MNPPESEGAAYYRGRRCLRCGEPCAATAESCAKCGFPLRPTPKLGGNYRFCPKCRAKNAKEAPYCVNCGHAFKSPDAAALSSAIVLFVFVGLPSAFMAACLIAAPISDPKNVDAGSAWTFGALALALFLATLISMILAIKRRNRK